MRESAATAARIRRLGRGAERRTHAVPLYTPERRSGFDRRRSYPLTGALRNSPHSLLVLLAAVNALSLLDFLLTWQEISVGIATEGNPLLAVMFSQGPVQAWLFKSAVVLLVSIGIWQGRRLRAVLGVAVFAFGAFAAVVGYHLIGMTVILAL